MLAFEESLELRQAGRTERDLADPVAADADRAAHLRLPSGEGESAVDPPQVGHLAQCEREGRRGCIAYPLGRCSTACGRQVVAQRTED